MNMEMVFIIFLFIFLMAVKFCGVNKTFFFCLATLNLGGHYLTLNVSLSIFHSGLTTMGNTSSTISSTKP